MNSEVSRDLKPVNPTELANAAPVTSPHVIVLVHGIRTNGDWFEMVAEELAKHPGVTVHKIRYRELQTLEFLFPFRTRDRAVKKVWDELSNIIAKQAGPVSVIAHSFGTYAIGSLLENEAGLRLFRILFCGSVLTQDFSWVNSGGKIGDCVVNDCGTKDIWPILAQATTWGYGASGVAGFGTPVIDRFFPFRHGDFFSREFVNKYWIPFIITGDIVEPEGDRPGSPGWFRYLALLPLKWFILLGLFGALILGGIFAFAGLSSLQPLRMTVSPRVSRRGQDMTWSLLQNARLAVKDRIDMRITANRNCWIYIFAEDPLGTISWLADEPFHCPGATGITITHISVTEPRGTQKLCIVASSDRIPALDKSIESHPTFWAEIPKSVLNRLLPLQIEPEPSPVVALEGIEKVTSPNHAVPVSGKQPIGLIWTYNVN
jgi:hypothetical protein